MRLAHGRQAHGRHVDPASGLDRFTALRALTLLHSYLVPEDGSGSPLMYKVHSQGRLPADMQRKPDDAVQARAVAAAHPTAQDVADPAAARAAAGHCKREPSHGRNPKNLIARRESYACVRE